MNERSRLLLGGLASVVLAILAASPTARFEFSGDDTVLILENENVRSLRKLPTLVRSDFFAHDLVGVPVRVGIGYYRPLTTATFALDWAAWGRNPLGFHRTNIAIHALTAFFVFLLGLALSMGVSAAAVAAAVFAVHPVNAQAVALVNARSDLLCTLGFTMAAWAAARVRPGPVVLGTFLAAFSKEPGVAAPLTVAVSLWICGAPRKRAVVIGLASCLVVLAYLWARRYVLVPSVHAGETQPFWSSLAGFALSGKATGVHFLALLGIDTQRIGFVVPPATWADPLVLLGAAVAVACVPVGVRLLRIRSVWLLPLTWISVGFIPLLLIGRVHVPMGGVVTPVHVRWMYLSSVGVGLSAGLWLERRHPPRWLVSLLAACVVLLVPVFWSRATSYRDDRAMALEDLRMYREIPEDRLPEPLRARRLEVEGIEAARAGDFPSAITAFRTALRYSPGDAGLTANLGAALMERGELDAAIRLLRNSLEPRRVTSEGERSIFVMDDARARRRPDRYALLGEALIRKGALVEATEALRSARRGDPAQPMHALNLGAVLARRGRWVEAGKQYEDALELRPCYPKAMIALREIARRTADPALEKRLISLEPGCSKSSAR